MPKFGVSIGGNVSVEKNSEALAHRFRQLRHAAGLTQVQVSEETGIPQSNVSAYELGAKMPPASACRALAECYQCSADLLLCIVDEGLVRGHGRMSFENETGRRERWDAR